MSEKSAIARSAPTAAAFQRFKATEPDSDALFMADPRLDDRARRFVPTPAGHSLTRAALRLARDAGSLEAVRFQKICEEADISRTSAYKWFEAGTNDLVDLYMRPEMVGTVLDLVDASVVALTRSSERGSWSYREVVTAGARAALQGLGAAPYSGRYLALHPFKAVEELFDPSEHGLLASLSNAVRSCLATIDVGEADATSFVERLLWRAVAHLQSFGSWPTGVLEWPAWIDETVGELAEVNDSEFDVRRSPISQPVDKREREIVARLINRRVAQH